MKQYQERVLIFFAEPDYTNDCVAISAFYAKVIHFILREEDHCQLLADELLRECTERKTLEYFIE